jgi:hypothetical protein
VEGIVDDDQGQSSKRFRATCGASQFDEFEIIIRAGNIEVNFIDQDTGIADCREQTQRKEWENQLFHNTRGGGKTRQNVRTKHVL